MLEAKIQPDPADRLASRLLSAYAERDSPTDTPSPRQVYLTPAQWARAAALGDGNRGEGLRRALDAYQPGTAGQDEG